MALTLTGFNGRDVHFDDIQQRCLEALLDNEANAVQDTCAPLIAENQQLRAQLAVLELRLAAAEKKAGLLREQLDGIVMASIAHLDPER
jgi:hypothetical protein